MVEPETVADAQIDPSVMPAAIAELSDRAHEGNISTNLSGVLVNR